MTFWIGRQGLSLRDARGHVGRVSFHYLFNDAAAGDAEAALSQVVLIDNAIIAASNCFPVGASGLASQVYNPQQYGAASPYSAAEDKARIVFQCTYPVVTGAPVRYVLSHLDVPAPVLSVFYADQETVDITTPSAAVEAIFVALNTPDSAGGRACTKDGAYYTSLVGGLLIRRKFQRKLTIWDKAANLVLVEE